MISISSPSPRKLPHSGNGQIQIIFGPMFSGKTTELIRRCKRYEIANYKCIIVKYARDNRYSIEQCATHDEISLPAIATIKLADVYNKLITYEIIGIDEGQFFPDVVETAESLANAGKTVIVAALDGTYQRQAFPSIINLVPFAENIVKLTSVCMICYNDAAFTKRKGNETALEVIGGSETYMSVCRKCYLQKTPQKRNVGVQTPEKVNISSEDSTETVNKSSLIQPKNLFVENGS